MWKLRKSHDPNSAFECAFSFDQLSTLADEELLVHLEHRHADAIAILYQRYRRLVFGVAYGVLRDRGEAEDVVQNVFVDLYKTTLRFDPARGTAKIWILQFAYSRSFRRKRQLTCRHFYSSIEISVVEDSLHASDSATEAVEHSRAVSSALATLREPQKQVIRLASEGHTLGDIAELSPPTFCTFAREFSAFTSQGLFLGGL